MSTGSFVRLGSVHLLVERQMTDRSSVSTRATRSGVLKRLGPTRQSPLSDAAGHPPARMHSGRRSQYARHANVDSTATGPCV